MKYFEMFAGYGTASFALKRIFVDELQCVGFSEVDKYAIKCFEQNHYPLWYNDGKYSYPHKNFGDCKLINTQELPDFDLLTGGFPCQAFSVAGKMQGELDSRGTLFNEIIRIAEVKRPKYMLLENVKGLTAKKFEGTFKKILSELDRIGYNVYWKVLNTKDYGIPQSRARVWFVCFRKDIDKKTFQWPQIEELKIFIKDILENDVDAKYYLSEKLQERFNKYLQDQETKIAAMRQRDRHGKNETREQQIEPRADGCSNSITTVEKDNLLIENQIKVLGSLDTEGWEKRHEQIRRIYNTEGIAPTLPTGTGGGVIPKIMEKDIANCLDANMQKGVTPEMHYEKKHRNVISCGKLRRLTPKECFRLQGFLNDEVNLNGLSDTQCYKLAGNGQSVNIVEKIFKEMFR